MTSPVCDVLILVEDPGAANNVLGLVEALRIRGRSARLFAVGPAVDYLRAFGEAPETDPGRDADALIDLVDPGLVLVGTSENTDSLCLALVVAARARHRPSAAVVDGPSSAAFRFRGHSSDPLAFAPDWLLVPESFTRDAYKDLGFLETRMITSGHALFDRVRIVGEALAEEGRDAVRHRVLPDAPDGRPILVFVAERSDGLDPGAFSRRSDYTLQGRGGSNRRTDIVLEEVLDGLTDLATRPYVVLRLHPKNTRAEFAAYEHEVDEVSAGGQAYEIVSAADAVVGLTSILLLEAAILDRPTLAVVPRVSERYWLASIAMGITPAVDSRTELRRTLSRLLAGETLGRRAQEVLKFGAIDHMAEALGLILTDAST
ncbi:MAG TPA: hypothetical protein QF891_03795 [Rhodospirillales bacterium]|jgi:hypothetical protein|nr:hypothetical protein [Rhodospirillales bacterium]